MRCPKCSCELKPWPWQDGGYKGVECAGCGARWWSDSFGSAAYDVERAATAVLISSLDFPKDAVSDEDYQRRLSEPPFGDDEVTPTDPGGPPE